MKKITLELEDDQYETFRSLNFEGVQTIQLGRVSIKVKVVDGNKKEVKAESVKEPEEKKYAPTDVNKDGKTDFKDLIEVAKGSVKGRKR